MKTPLSQDTLTRICRDATSCRACFDDLGLESAATDIAQPRWVGSAYSTAPVRVACVLLNPGAGAQRKNASDSLGHMLIKDFAKGDAPLQSLFEHQARSMPTWGRKRFLPFYTSGLGLDLTEIAFANIAWCATRGNKYPDPMLARCFQKHTLPLLVELKPDIVLLSGSKTHWFFSAVESSIPGATAIGMLHYAHRKGHEATQEEHRRIRTLIQNIKDAR